MEEQRLSKLETEVADLKTRLAIVETNIKEIYKTLDSIDNNTTWILRLVIGGLIAGVLGLIIKGGFQI
ncbi:MAG: hemolysin XhlA family protein [Bacillota bacterium]|nr:hemolysin XhlA family protein [Bacillota bacterium]